MSDPLKKKMLQEEECLDCDDAPLDDVEAGEQDEQDKQSLCVAACTIAMAIPALIGSCCWPILVGAMFAVAAGNVNGGLVDFFHGVQVAIMFGLMTNIVQFAWWKVKGKKHLAHCARMRPVYLLMFATCLVCTQPVSMLVIGSWDSIPNFFFDGGDMGSACTGTTVCGSGMCSTDSNQFAIDYIWKTTGCTAKAPPGFLDTYYQGRNPSDLADEVFQLCQGKVDGLGMSVCGASDISKCIRVASVKADTDFTQCTNDDFSKATACSGSCAMDSNALFPNTGTGIAIQIFCTYGGFIVMFVGVFEATGLHKKIMKKWNNLRRAM